MHVTVDPSLCQGTGYCARVAPELFELTDEDLARVIRVEPEDDASAERAIEAESLCPSGAVQL